MQGKFGTNKMPEPRSGGFYTHQKPDDGAQQQQQRELRPGYVHGSDVIFKKQYSGEGESSLVPVDRNPLLEASPYKDPQRGDAVHDNSLPALFRGNGGSQGANAPSPPPLVQPDAAPIPGWAPQFSPQAQAQVQARQQGGGAAAQLAGGGIDQLLAAMLPAGVDINKIMNG